jgi:hypothetical protein
MFRPPVNENYFLIQKKDFKGDGNAYFLQACQGIAYIVSKNGLFCFRSNNKRCEKIASATFVAKHLKLQAVIRCGELSERPYYRLQKEQIACVKAATQVACCFRGLQDTVPYERVHMVIKALMFKGNLLRDLQELSANSASSRYILALIRPPAGRPDLSHLIYLPELTQEQRNNLIGMVDMNVVLRNTIFVDLLRVTANKSPVDIANYFADYCETIFNDSVLAEEWMNAAALLSPRSENHRPERRVRSHSF